MTTEPPRADSDERAHRYRAQGSLGQGGMGTIERVLDTARGETLAMKRLLLGAIAESRHPHYVALFEREFHVLSQLAHPSIIRVFDYGIDERGPYYTMQLLDGRDLREQAPLPWRRMCEIARDVASSLSLLHTRGFVHRDVTPGNVRCTEDGRAKLLDFGAMCAIGVAKDVVGTPPYLAPEVLARTALDGRVDLYALGATLYVCIAGEHAYPARSAEELRELWLLPPKPLKHLVPDVPEGLDHLVMELLAIDVAGRPQNATVVMERLGAIAGLARDETLDVGAAYLSTPTLVGREHALGRCRGVLLAALAGHGGSVLLCGEAGIGRSRMLDALALEAKLRGALVLRADPSDAESPGGVLGRLLRQAAQDRPGALDEVDGAAHDAGQRDALLARFARGIEQLSASATVALLVDDLQEVDEPALAGLATLTATLSDRCVLLAATVERDVPATSPAALDLLREASRVVELTALSEPEVRALLSSAFSEADNLEQLAHVLSGYAGGNPGRTMDAAQRLVDAGVVRYHAGAWQLPDRVERLRSALPDDLRLRARLSALSPDARELGALLALSVEPLELQDYAALTEHGDRARVHAALAQLVRARILVDAGESRLFARPHYRAELAAALDDDRARAALHGRLARFVAAGGGTESSAARARTLLIALHHAFHAQDWTAVDVALDAVDAILDDFRMLPRDIRFAGDLESLTALIDARAPRPGLPQGRFLVLRLLVHQLAVEDVDWAQVVRLAQPTIEVLWERLGLDDYEALAEAPEEQRLRLAIERAEARQRAAEPSLGRARALLPSIGSIGYAVLANAHAMINALDPGLLRWAPSLEPLYPLSSTFRIIDRLRGALQDAYRGEVTTAHVVFCELHEQLATEMPGLGEPQRAALEANCRDCRQAVEALMGLPEVLARAELTALQVPAQAEAERRAYYLAIGDADQAAAARQRADRLEVGAGLRRRFPTLWIQEYVLCSLTEDVLGLKRCEHEAADVAAQLPAWRHRAELARIRQAMCGATTEATLVELDRLLAQIPREAADYDRVRFERIIALSRLGLHQECLAACEAAHEQLGRAPRWHDASFLGLAIALSKVDRHADARATIEQLLSAMQTAGVRGLLLGHVHEEAAYIALAAGDRARFQTHAAACAEQYRAGHNPSLTARHDALLRAARGHAIDGTA